MERKTAVENGAKATGIINIFTLRIDKTPIDVYVFF